jgi:hypothetical protein
MDMDQKIAITKFVAEQSGLSTDPKSLKRWTTQWWCNPRQKLKGGLKLTEEGFARLTTQFDCHRIRLEEPIEYTNQMILRFDNWVTCPWYITNRDIFVFNDKTAVELVLFSGNIRRFFSAKAMSLDKTT